MGTKLAFLLFFTFFNLTKNSVAAKVMHTSGEKTLYDSIVAQNDTEGEGLPKDSLTTSLDGFVPIYKGAQTSLDGGVSYFIEDTSPGVTAVCSSLNRNKMLFSCDFRGGSLKRERVRKKLQLYKKKAEGRYSIKVFGADLVYESIDEILFQGRLTNNRDYIQASVSGFEISKLTIENFKGWPIDLFTVFGLSQHKDGVDRVGIRESFVAVTFGVKAEWKSFPWNHYVRTKISFTEGINYSEEVGYWEERNISWQSEGRTSNLMNYLGFGISLNARDLFGVKSWEKCCVGGYLYHRSGVFKLIDAFNNTTGGINYVGLSLECSN